MTQGFAGGAEGIEHRPDIDWEAVERSPEFVELIRRKKAFVVPATVFFMAWYFGFIILCGIRARLHGPRVHHRRPDGRLRARPEPVRDDRGCSAGCTCGRPTEFDPLAAGRARRSRARAPAPSERRFRRGAIVDEPVTPSATSEEVPRQ